MIKKIILIQRIKNNLSNNNVVGNEITYKPLKETSFSRIKRYISDNHWEVTDKNGTKRIYAQTEKSSACSQRRDANLI